MLGIWDTTRVAWTYALDPYTAKPCYQEKLKQVQEKIDTILKLQAEKEKLEAAQAAALDAEIAALPAPGPSTPCCLPGRVTRCLACWLLDLWN